MTAQSPRQESWSSVEKFGVCMHLPRSEQTQYITIYLQYISSMSFCRQILELPLSRCIHLQPDGDNRDAAEIPRNHLLRNCGTKTLKLVTLVKRTILTSRRGDFA